MAAKFYPHLFRPLDLGTFASTTTAPPFFLPAHWPSVMTVTPVTGISLKVSYTIRSARRSLAWSFMCVDKRHYATLPLPPAGFTVLKNRALMGSMHTGLEDGAVLGGGLSKLGAFLAERAKGGVGLIVTGGIAPNRAGRVSPFAAKLSNSLEMRAHRDVTDPVHEVGRSAGPCSNHSEMHAQQHLPGCFFYDPSPSLYILT